MAAITSLLEEHGHTVVRYTRSAAEITTLGDRCKAVFTGIRSGRAIRDVLELIDREHPDIVQVQNLYPQISPAILPAIKRTGTPIVMRCPNYRLFCPTGLHLCKGRVCERCLTGARELNCVLHNCMAHIGRSAAYALRNAWARVTRKFIDNVDTFVVLSEFQKQRFIAGGIPSDRIAIVPNIAPAVETDSSLPPSETRDNPVPQDYIGANRVTYVGRISPEKGIGEFVEAARLLPDIPFAVAGDDSQMPVLRADSPENIEWRGFLTGDDLNRLYADSRILVLPSICFEGFPNVITRAMQCGKPVIAARIGALLEIVKDGRTGLLFRPGDATDLARKISDLHGDPGLCRALGKAGRERVMQHYSREVVSRSWLAVYQDSLSLG